MLLQIIKEEMTPIGCDHMDLNTQGLLKKATTSTASLNLPKRKARSIDTYHSWGIKFRIAVTATLRVIQVQ